MRRWAIRSTNAVLFVLGCFFAAQVITALLAEAALPVQSEVSAVTPVVHTPRQHSEQRRAILDRNLFGARLAGEGEEEEPETIEAVETELPLLLLGTVASDAPGLSNAAIMDRGTRKHQVVFVGDRLERHPNVEVLSIHRRTVILRNGAKRERLDLSEEGPTTVAARTGARRPARAARTAQRQARRETIAERLEDLKAGDGRTTASLYSAARIVPEWKDGAMVGVRLNQVKPGSLYDKIGIESGDVITSLNGIRIDSPQASSRLLTEFTQAEQFEIELEDGNTIDVPADELAELLEEEG